MPYVDYDEVEASCSECGRPFRSPEQLEQHRAESHPTENRYGRSAGDQERSTVCSHCHREFDRPTALERHLKSAHR